MTPPPCAAAGLCTRPATNILITDHGATPLCNQHDGLAVAHSLQHRDGELSRYIVEPVAEVTS